MRNGSLKQSVIRLATERPRLVYVVVVLTYFVHPDFVWLTVFVGANPFQQSFTGFCPAAIVMQKLFGLKQQRQLAIE